MKECRRCSVEKPHSEFHKNKARRDGLHYYCKECSKAYYTKWQDRNPESKKRYNEWKTERRKESREKLVAYLREHPCVDCGNSDLRVLVFDHVRGTKRNGVASLASQGAKWETILEEVAKCEVRCHNCHVIVTQERGGFWLTDLAA